MPRRDPTGSGLAPTKPLTCTGVRMSLVVAPGLDSIGQLLAVVLQIEIAEHGGTFGADTSPAVRSLANLCMSERLACDIGTEPRGLEHVDRTFQGVRCRASTSWESPR